MTQVLTINISGIDEGAYRILYSLSDNERQKRADRYLRQEDRVRCICAGLLLRLALGRADFEIQIGPYGKPIVKNEPNFHYNLSHSGNWVAIAYGTSPVGIDVEQINWDSSKEKLAKRFFTADEQAYVFGQDAQGRAERFFEIWTSKESYLKYLGTGLRKSLGSFSVLQLNFPNRSSFQPAEGYSLSLWTEEQQYERRIVSVSDLMQYEE